MFFNKKRTCNQYFLQISSLNSVKKEGFLSSLRERYFPCDLIRIGAAHDGGYLVPNVLSEMDFCFSPGVGDLADFEKQLVDDFNIECFLCDASVEHSPVNSEKITFQKKFLGVRNDEKTVTLKKWVSDSTIGRFGRSILQMDIEGGEYEVLAFEDVSTLNMFSLILIEFHNLDTWGQGGMLQIINGIFEKLFENFLICHIHPNNYGGTWVWEGVDTPRVIEVTFVNKNIINLLHPTAKVVNPHKFDQHNEPSIDVVSLPKEWFEAAFC